MLENINYSVETVQLNKRNIKNRINSKILSSAKKIYLSEQSNKENLCDVYAYLTIKGITHEINFPASYSFINDQINIKTNFKIDRNKWGINYSNASTINILKEKIIDDMITIDINVFAKKE